jgi:hypothetical protein
MSQDGIQTEQLLKSDPNAPVDAGPISGQLVIDPGESAAINNLKQRANSLMTEIGRIECEKQRALMGFFDSEARCQEILQRAAQRFGIPQGMVWQVDEKGHVFLRTDQGTIPMTKDHLPGEEAAGDQPPPPQQQE